MAAILRNSIAKKALLEGLGINESSKLQSRIFLHSGFVLWNNCLLDFRADSEVGQFGL